MQFHNFLLTAVFTSLSIAVPVTTTTTSISSCVATSLSPPPPNKHCGDQGTLTNPSLLSTAITTTFNDCTNTCLVSNACQSFSFDSNSSVCQLYAKTINDQGFSTERIDPNVKYYAADCFRCIRTAAAATTTTTSLSTKSTTTPSATSTTTPPTPTTTTFPTCTQTAFSVSGLVYQRYYLGSGYTLDPTSSINSNSTYPMIPELVGWVPANQPCAAITACSAWAYLQKGVYASFEVHLSTASGQSPLWECWAFQGRASETSAFNVKNESIAEAYGFSL